MFHRHLLPCGGRDPDFRGTRFEFRDLRIVFSRSGDVAWYSCNLDDCGSYKGRETCLKDGFQTGVLEKRDGRWVHVLMHGSYPIDTVPENEAEAGGDARPPSLEGLRPVRAVEGGVDLDRGAPLTGAGP